MLDRNKGWCGKEHYDDGRYLERLVPGGGHEAGVVGRLDPVAGLDRGVVGRHLHRLVASQVPALDTLVRRRHEHL